MRRLPIAIAAPLAMAAAAPELTVEKSFAPVADGLGLLKPRFLPGALVEATLRGTTADRAVAGVTMRDDLPDGMAMRVADLGAAGSGPVAFSDGSLLDTGVVGSGLSYRFAGLANGRDSLDFSRNGTDWSYVPQPDADGFDPAVRAIRIRLSGQQATRSFFALRYRARVR